MKKILIISIALFISVSSFCQLDITKSTVTTDTLRSRSDKMYFSNGLGSITWMKTSGDSLFFNDATGTFSLSDFSSISYYGEMHSDLDSAVDYGNPSDSIWFSIDTLISGLNSGFSFVATDTVDYLTCSNTGLYEITYYAKYKLDWGFNDQTTKVSIFKDNTLIEKSISEIYVFNAAGHNYFMSNSFFTVITAGEKIKLKIWLSEEIDNFIFCSGSVTIKKLL